MLMLDNLLQNGGSLTQTVDTLNRLQVASQVNAETSTDWDDALKIAETAALPAET